MRGQQDSIWLNGLALAKGAYRVQYKNGKLNKSFNTLPPSVLFVERAALVEHMILEIERIESDRYVSFSQELEENRCLAHGFIVNLFSGCLQIACHLPCALFCLSLKS